MWKKTKIGHKLTIVFSVVLIFSLVTSYYFIFEVIKDRLLERKRNQVINVGNYILELIAEQKRKSLNIVELLLRDKELRNDFDYAILAGEYKKILETLTNIYQRLELNFLEVGDLQGRVAVSATDPNKYGYDRSHQKIIKQALAGQSTVDLVEEQGELIIRASGLLRWGRESIGSLDPSGDIIESDMVGEEKSLGTILSGIHLNNTFNERIKEITGAEISVMNNERIMATTIDSLRDQKVLPILEAFRKRDNPIPQLRLINGEPHTIMLLPLKAADKQRVGWLMVSLNNEDIITARNRSIKTLLLILVITAGMTIIVAMIFTRGIIHPITLLTKAAKKVSEGHLEQKIDVKIEDEIGELANVFNEMTKDLKRSREEIEEYSRTLEERVEERTQELKETQDQLIQSEKLATIGIMAGGIAHEINTPLAAILNNSELLLMENASDDLRERFEMIRDSSLKCKFIVQQLLKYSHKASIDFKPVDIKSVIEDACALIENQMKNDNIIIERHYAELPPIKASETELVQVVMNLLVNARDSIRNTQKTLKRQGLIQIITRYQNKANIIEIVDNGSGIPESIIKKIFDPFYTTKDVGQGTGLGLYVVRRIIERHDGKIEVNSSKDQGTTFKITFSLDLKA